MIVYPLSLLPEEILKEPIIVSRTPHLAQVAAIEDIPILIELPSLIMTLRERQEIRAALKKVTGEKYVLMVERIENKIIIRSIGRRVIECIA